MESSSSRLEQEQRRQDALRKQIARLQSQLKEIPGDPLVITESRLPLASPKRKPSESSLLVPPTPSPSKCWPSIKNTCILMNGVEKRKLNHHARGESSQSAQPAASGTLSSSKHGTSLIKSRAQPEKQYTKLAPSKVLNQLATLNHRPVDDEPRDRVIRSSGFAEPPSNPIPKNDDVAGIPAPNRDERLVIIEDLEPGPAEHTPPSDDPEFQQLEPNSGIRLR